MVAGARGGKKEIRAVHVCESVSAIDAFEIQLKIDAETCVATPRERGQSRIRMKSIQRFSCGY